MITTINMVKNVLAVLMESSSRGIDARKLEKGVCEVERVVVVHPLHIWSITTSKVLLAFHVTIVQEADFDVVLDQVIEFIEKEFNINDVTIHIEREKAPK
ncbi:Metal tolerance protein 1 [Platanthera zijinensis]|uniref:Metal tolerance protein 1 n=1 Tax=Platanthera zijinensis TaxID=2320716 RepID=A0AAP0BCQ1_9ASPA